MTTFGSQILIGLQVLAQPQNLIALVAGLLAGVVLGALFRRVGVSGAAALVLLMPVAITLDPTTGLVLLAACLTTAMIAMIPTSLASTDAPTARRYSLPLCASTESRHCSNVSRRRFMREKKRFAGSRASFASSHADACR